MKYVLLVLVMLGGSAHAAAAKKSFGQRVVAGAKNVKDSVVGFFGKGHGPSQPVKTLWQKGADASLAEAGSSGPVRRETFDSDVVRADEALQSMFVPQQPRQPTQQSNYGFPRATSPYHGSTESIYVPRSGDPVVTQPAVPSTMIVRSEPVVQQASFSKAKSIAEQLATMRKLRQSENTNFKTIENHQIRGVATEQHVFLQLEHVDVALQTATAQQQKIQKQLAIPTLSSRERKQLSQEAKKIAEEIVALWKQRGELQKTDAAVAALNKPDGLLARVGEWFVNDRSTTETLAAGEQYDARQAALRSHQKQLKAEQQTARGPGSAKSPVGYLKDSLKTARTSAAEIVQRIKALRLRPGNGRRSASSPVAQQAE